MAFYNTKGIIIKRAPSGEADRVITIFTRDIGKIRAVGKGTRRITSRLASELELFNYTDFLITHGKNFDVITGAVANRRFQNLKNDLKKVSLAEYLAGLIDEFSAEQPNKEIFSLLKKILVFLDKEKRESDLWLIARNFEWEFLNKNGIAPKLYNCSLCHKKLKPEKIFLDQKGHGFLCFDCGKNKNLKPISLEAIKILRLISEKDFNCLLKIKLERPQKEETKKALQYFFENI